MRLDRFGTLAVVRPAQRAGFWSESAAISVLLYHSVSNELDLKLPPYYRLVTSVDRFRRHMQLLRDEGYRATSLLEALRNQAGQQAGGGARAVVVTFDDGLQDLLTSAWPILFECGVMPTVFLPTGFVGGARRSFKDRPCLTWPEVRELSRHGVSFGSHTVSHPVLHNLPWPRVRRELRESREAIESALGVAVTTFSYPYAFPQEDESYSERLRQELIEQGYEASVTTAIGRMSHLADHLRIRRLPVNDCDDDALFLAKVGGAYDWTGALQAGWRRLKRGRIASGTAGRDSAE